MNGKIKELKYCPKKGSPFVDMDTAKIDKKGISDDFHYGDEIPLSIYFERGGEEYPDGFCAGKFFPNIVIDELSDQGDSLKIGQTIKIGQVQLSINKMKRCYSDCPVPNKSNCRYNDSCVFASVISDGDIKIGDTISVL